MDLPAELLPTGQMLVTLSDDKTVALPVCSPTFSKWKGALPAFSFGNKQFLDYEGMPVFAEIVVLNILLKNGWQGVWVETYGGIHFLCSQPQGSKLNSITIPKEKEDLLARIWRATNNKGKGCFDIYAWKNHRVMFCETKLRGKDRLTTPQIRFIDGALKNGIPKTSLLIAEWTTN
ncbi:MAG: hypothetical protein AAB830_01395 [Patescibacteria group bacterium]